MNDIAGIPPDIAALFTPLAEERAPETLGFANSDLDRSAFLRTKPEALAMLEAEAATRFYVFLGEHIVLKAGVSAEPALFAFDEMPGAAHFREQIFLGREGEAARFAMLLDNAAEAELQAEPALELVGLRALALGEKVTPGALGAIAQGKAMLHWHARHRFCANCGGPTTVHEAGWKRGCEACGAEHFPRTDPVVIMLTIDGDRCLLGRGPKFPPGWYSTLAGFVEPGETIEDAVRRETMEEAGIVGGRVTLMANQPWPFPASLMIGAFVEAKSTKIAVDRDELEDCRWFSRDEVRLMLAGTHPDGLGVPAKMSIASHLIRHFVGEA